MNLIKPKFFTGAKLFYVLACMLLLGQYFGSLTQLQAAGNTASGTDISTVLPADAKNTIIDSATASFTDASGNPVGPQSVTSSTNINLAYQWSIPDALNDGYQLKAGDYFTFQLPDQISVAPQNGDLGSYGKYNVDENGRVTFTFNQSVENHNEISGTFNYSRNIKQTTTTGEQVISIPTKDGPYNTKFTVNPTGGNAIAKTGTVTSDKRGVIWSVTVNTNLNELKSAQIIDTMPANTTLVKTVVYPVTVDLKGNVTATGTALTADQDYTVDKNGTITLIGQYADTRQAFKVEYTTTIDAAAVPEDGGSVEFNNTAILRNNEQDADANASVTVNYRNFLDKKFDGQDNNGGQKYNWHIDYNFNEKQLPENTQLTDQLSDNQTFSGVPKLTYEDGTTVPQDQYRVDYDTANRKMTITFPNGLIKGVKVAYQSKLIDPNDVTTTISNSASSDGKTVNAGDDDVKQQGLTKTVDTVDYNAKTVAWHLDINMARQDMADWVLTDTVPDGLTLNSDSFVLQDKDTNTTLTNGIDYQITAQEGGFKLEFLGDLKAHAKDWYTLTYTTNFDINKLPANQTKWTNKATATWKDQKGNSHTNNGQADFTPKLEFIDDGSKSGSYNATTKTIQWTVVVNYNQWTLADGAAITDAIVGDQDYVANSAKLTTAKIGKDGSYTPGDAVSDPSIQYDATKKTLTASLPKGDSAYVLTYETSLAGKVIDQPTYYNTASYQNGDEKHDLTAKVTVPYSGNLAEKSGQQDSKNSSYVDYQIWVNKAQSTLKEVVVDDTPSANQIVDKNSIVIYPTTVATDGNVTEKTDAPLVLDKDYTVDLTTDPTSGKQELKIAFKNQITSAYSIRYQSLINSSLINDTVSNSVTITGTGEKTVTTTKESSTAVYNSNGSATGKNLNLVIEKTDADTQKVLPGAAFDLYADNNGQKGQLLRSGTTDQNGKLVWNNLKSGKYILLESKAPAGYIIDSDYAQGKEISLDYTKVDTDNNTTLKVTNRQDQTSISGKKTWADNNNQDGQRPDQITVHLLGNGKEVGKATVTAKDNWQYSFDNLPKYENGKAIVYTIQEDKVPGYATTINGFDITNTRTKTPSTPGASSNSKTPGSQGPKNSNSDNSTTSAGRLPQTNEQSNKGLMVMGLVLVVAVISYCAFQRKQRKN